MSRAQSPRLPVFSNQSWPRGRRPPSCPNKGGAGWHSPTDSNRSDDALAVQSPIDPFRRRGSGSGDTPGVCKFGAPQRSRPSPDPATRAGAPVGFEIPLPRARRERRPSGPLNGLTEGGSHDTALNAADPVRAHRRHAYGGPGSCGVFIELRDMNKRLRNAGQNNEANKVKKFQKEQGQRNKQKRQKRFPKMRLGPPIFIIPETLCPILPEFCDPIADNSVPDGPACGPDPALS